MTRPIMLVTGGGRGIGAATAVLAAQEGYDLCINYAQDQASARDVAGRCEANGARCLLVRADIGDEAQVTSLFEACEQSFGPLDVLVNNAGIIGQASRVEDLDPAVLRRTFDVNVHGAIFCAQQAVRRMGKEHGGNGGVIVNLSSIAASLGSPGEYVHYAASKAAIETFTIGLAKEVGRSGIRVNAIQAGTTDTEIHARSGNPGRPAMVAEMAPLGRVATPSDIAEAVVWLASKRAAYASGAILRIGGGL